MIMIKAVSFNGQPITTALGAEFGEDGGVIGRGSGNALVLPDPERFVSRAHAAIAYRGGNYVIRDLSSASPVYLNGIPLGNGREANLACGDELRIGAYALQVLPEAPPTAGPSGPDRAGVPVDDPLGMFGDSAMAPLAQQVPDSTARGSGGIPDDFDPFADLAPASAAGEGHGSGPSAPDGLQLGLEPAGNADINQLFGLGPNAGKGLFPDGHPLAANPADIGSADPLVALGAMPQPQPAADSQRDDAPEIHASFVPPKNMVVSWKTEEQPLAGGIKTMTMRSPAEPVPRAEDSAPIPAGPQAPIREATAPQAPALPPGPDADGDLLHAFLKGAGVPDLEMGASLTPEMMAMFGQLLRESLQGTLDLLMARTLTKREMHAQMTVIAMRENNPLKFSPNVEVALHSLLVPRGKGFMPPLQAMRDAYDDLRAHQFGVMAGMRAALARVLYRFDPVQLEERLTDKSLVDTLLPANRKAKLWAQYLELYTDITREAEDDFDTWFGREFLTAYEAQMAKLKQDGQRDLR
ncbi:type VI secretion system-associated FHA domain protein TagH [Pseudoduganella sp. HUAS MS19]